MLHVVAFCFAFGMIFIDGLRRLSGKKSAFKKRAHEKSQSMDDWLLGSAQKQHCMFYEDKSLVVHCSRSSASSIVWDASLPPVLVADGVSHLYGIMGLFLTKVLLGDIIIRPEPTDIPAPASVVWDVVTDFDKYEEWNPFQKRVEVVESHEGFVCIRMTVKLGVLDIVSTEKIYYCDSNRFILAYGIDRDGPASLRVVYLEALSPFLTRLNSYDIISGYPALFCRGYLRNVIYNGFTNSHNAMKLRCGEMLKLKKR